MTLTNGTTVCRHCERRIVFDAVDGWVDPEADGDDRMWRETCDRHDTLTAKHEPLYLTKAQIVNGTGFPANARFILVTTERTEELDELLTNGREALRSYNPDLAPGEDVDNDAIAQQIIEAFEALHGDS